MVRKTFVITFLLFLVLIVFASAHEEAVSDYGLRLHEQALNVVIVAAVIVVGALIAASYAKSISEKRKWVLFLVIVITVLIATIYSAGTTIYLNVISETGGPVHWHADFEIWNCGESVDLITPTGLSNRVGTPVYHEHNDNRLHTEGVVVKRSDVDLHEFFEVTGGVLTNDYLRMPTDDGVVEIKNGDDCNGQPGKLQAFVYQVENAYASQNKDFIVTQTKVENFSDYILSPYINVPPGDCIIIEFDEEKSRTDKLCETYNVALHNGEMVIHGS
jgi:hypothetical protein